jgi:hypothetical protein
MYLGKEEGCTMDTTMSITEFSMFLASEREETPLLDLLRQLTKIERVEVVRAVGEKADVPLGAWSGWQVG